MKEAQQPSTKSRLQQAVDWRVQFRIARKTPPYFSPDFRLRDDKATVRLGAAGQLDIGRPPRTGTRLVLSAVQPQEWLHRWLSVTILHGCTTRRL